LSASSGGDSSARRLGLAAGILTLVIGVHELQRTFTEWSVFPQPFADTLPMPRWRTIAHTFTGVALCAMVLWTSTAARRFAAVVGAVVGTLSLAALAVKFLPVDALPWLERTRTIAGVIGVLEGAGLVLVARRHRAAANLAGLAVLAIGATVIIGYLYGGSFYASSPVVNFAATLLAVCEGTAILAIGEFLGWPFSLVERRPVSARLMRSFLPFVALTVLLTDFATIFLFRDVSALGSAINTMVSVGIAAALTIAAGRVIDAQIDRANASLLASQTALKETIVELRALSSRMNGIREQERTRIARDVHDHLGQALTAMRMDIGEASRRLARGDHDGAGGRLAEMDSLAARAIDDVRRVARELRPVLLDELGFEDALRAYVSDYHRRSSLQCEVTIDGDPGMIDPDRSMALFRILQEALTNVSRHAEATRVTVNVVVDDGRARLTVTDDGCGIRPASARPGALGMTSMQDRAQLFGGRVAVTSTVGAGTTLEADIPLEEAS
jgi:signal transduction histidine kinase